MKKLITFVAVLAMLIPLSAMAMTPVADSELAEVTGQVGIDIAVVDFHMDMSIGNVAWGDTDNYSGSASDPLQMFVAGSPTDYTDGYININNIVMKDIFVTMNAVKSHSGTTVTSAFADPLKIDVATLGDAAVGTQIYSGLANKTAIVITMGDMHLQIASIDVGGIYLADEVYSGSSSFVSLDTDLGYADEFVCEASDAMAETENLGTLNISCVDVVLYSYVEGYANDGSGHINPDNPARVYILAH